MIAMVNAELNKEDFFYRRFGFKFMEETGKLPILVHSFVWC